MAELAEKRGAEFIAVCYDQMDRDEIKNFWREPENGSQICILDDALGVLTNRKLSPFFENLVLVNRQ